MAKSIRAKSRRRARAIKRDQLQPKVMKQLAEIVSNQEGSVLLPRKVPRKKEGQDIKVEPVADGGDAMDATTTSTINLKTMKLADGSYPKWMSQKKILKLKKAAKGQKTGLGRKGRLRKRR